MEPVIADPVSAPTQFSRDLSYNWFVLHSVGRQRTMADTNVNFEVEIHVAQRGEHLYAATIMPFHVTGYSDTFGGCD